MASTYEKFDAVIVDADISTRMRLRQATGSVPQFGKVAVVGDTHEALGRLGTPDRCDVVFLSSKFEDNDIQEFVRRGKETKQGQDSTYILVLGTNNQDSSTIANSVMIGVDGFLFEPYSVDQLVEITTLSAKVRRERGLARERVAITLTVTEMVKQLDLVAFLKGAGTEPGTSIKKLRDLAQPLHNLNSETLPIYWEVAMKTFEEAPPPKKAMRVDNYKGASSRVKKRMEQKMVEKAEAMFKGDGEGVKS